MSKAKKTSKAPKKSDRLEIDEQPLKGGVVLPRPPGLPPKPPGNTGPLPPGFPGGPDGPKPWSIP